MATIYEENASSLIHEAAQSLKKEIKMPDWARFVKTGEFKTLPPLEKDWWYLRAASILRRVYVYGPIGVSKLRVKYGGRKNRGHKPEEFRIASGKIIRTIMQQLENTGMVEKTKRGMHHGRIITAKGKSFLDKIATQELKKQKLSVTPKQPVQEKEVNKK